MIDFWKTVEDIGWETKTTNYKAVEKELLLTIKADEALDLRSSFSEYKSKLSRALNKWADVECKHFDVSSDGWNDLLAHIIGLGKEEYEKVLASPKLAWDRARAYNYTESFSYCLPYKDAYSKLNPNKYIKWAKKAQPVYEEMAKLAEFVCMGKEFQVIQDNLNAITNKQFEFAIANYDTIKKALVDIQYFCERNSNPFITYNAPNKWGILNLISDIQTYMVKDV